MEDFACPTPENVSPITDLSRNLTTLRTLSESWIGTPQMPPKLNMSAAATPDSSSSFRLKSFTPASECSSESEAEPSPLTVNLHKRVILAQVNKSINHESPFLINRVSLSATNRRFFKRPSLEVSSGAGSSITSNSSQGTGTNVGEESPMRKNSSQGYCSSTSDGFALDEVGLEDENDSANKENREPADATLVSLLSAPISVPVKDLCTGRRVGPSARRNLSFNAASHNNETPIKSKRADDDDRSTKRTRLCLAERTNNMLKLPKFYSESHIDREAAEDVIDKGIVEILPTIGAHKRCALPTISVQTLCDILNGKFDQVVNSFEIIDCRWPYEFDGGHIRGAKNLYTQEQIFKEYLENDREPKMNDEGSLVPSTSRTKRDILIFHCEFSSERGPKMSQYLREKDRESNVYPKLSYPEVYILKGGYKEFFDSYKELCVPQEYMRMVDERYTDECRLYRSQSKNFDKKNFSRNQSSRF